MAFLSWFAAHRSVRFAESVRGYGYRCRRLAGSRRPLCRACLDWSVRRSHLAGSIGAAMLDGIIARGRARREKDSRVLAFTPPGRAAFGKLLRS